MRKWILIFVFSLIGLAGAYGVPAYPHKIAIDINGQQVYIRLFGDEYYHWAETEDGYSLMYNNAGYMCYAYLDNNGNMQPSKYIATDINKISSVVNKFLSTVPKKIFYSKFANS